MQNLPKSFATHEKAIYCRQIAKMMFSTNMSVIKRGLNRKHAAILPFYEFAEFSDSNECSAPFGKTANMLFVWHTTHQYVKRIWMLLIIWSDFSKPDWFALILPLIVNIIIATLQILSSHNLHIFVILILLQLNKNALQ